MDKKEQGMVDFTETELKIREFIKNGKTEKEIAEKLHISIHTVKSYIKASQYNK